MACRFSAACSSTPLLAHLIRQFLWAWIIGVCPTRSRSAASKGSTLSSFLFFSCLRFPSFPQPRAPTLCEREVKSKHQQIVSGVGIVAYWLANFIFDNVVYWLTLFLFVLLIAGPVFGKDAGQLGGNGRTYEIQYLFGLLYLFGFAIFGFTYLLAFCFKTPSAAQVAIIFAVFITGVILGLVGCLAPSH